MRKLYMTLLAFLLAGCSSVSSAVPSSSAVAEEPETPEISEVNEAAEDELELKTLDMKGYVWLEDENPAFKQISFTESFRLFEEGRTGLLVYSFDTCPFCNRAIPVLNEAAKEKGLEVYYVDIYEPEMTYLTDEKQFDKDLHHLHTLLDPMLKKEVNEKTGELKPIFLVPAVIAIVDGEIADYHVSLTSDFFMEDEKTQMTDVQREEMKQTYLHLCDIILEHQ